MFSRTHLVFQTSHRKKPCCVYPSTKWHPLTETIRFLSMSPLIHLWGGALWHTSGDIQWEEKMWTFSWAMKSPLFPTTFILTHCLYNLLALNCLTVLSDNKQVWGGLKHSKEESEILFILINIFWRQHFPDNEVCCNLLQIIENKLIYFS